MNKEIKRSKGFTLPELMLGLAVISIAAVFIFQAGVGIMNSQKSSSFQSLHNDLVTRISKFYSPTFDYSSLTTQVVAQARLAPAAMMSDTSATSIKTPYAAAIGQIAQVTGHPELFAVNYSGLPVSTCAEDVITLSARSIAVAFITGVASDADVTMPSGAAVKNLVAGQELDRVAVATGCSAATGGSYGVTFIQQ